MHVTRSPARQLLILRRLVELHGVLRDAGIDAPQSLESAIARMAAALRGLRHGDGRLCLFNDSNEEENWLIDLVLSRAEMRGHHVETSPEDAGFQRLAANRTMVVMDAGAAAPAGLRPARPCRHAELRDERRTPAHGGQLRRLFRARARTGASPSAPPPPTPP